MEEKITGTVKPYPAGTYCLLTTNKPIDPDILDLEYILGFRLRSGWTDLQPAMGDFNFTYIDEQVASAKAKGRFLGLGISAGVTAPPELWSKKGVTKFTLSPDDITIEKSPPDMGLPWEPAFQSYWFKVIGALGKRYDNERTVSYVVVSGFMQLMENRFVLTAEDEARVQTLAKAAGYADFAAAYTDGAQKIIARYMQAFPRTPVILTTTARVITSDPTIGKTLVTWAKAQYPKRFGTMTAGLMATQPPHDPNTNAPLTFPQGDQPIFSSSDQERFYKDPIPVPFPNAPQPVDDLLAAAVTKNDMWVELYMEDCKNITNREVIVARNLELIAVANKAQGF